MSRYTHRVHTHRAVRVNTLTACFSTYGYQSHRVAMKKYMEDEAEREKKSRNNGTEKGKK